VGGDKGEGEHPHPVKSPKGGPPEAAFNRAGPLPLREREHFRLFMNSSIKRKGCGGRNI